MLEEYIINAKDFLINKITAISNNNHIDIPQLHDLNKCSLEELFDIACQVRELSDSDHTK